VPPDISQLEGPAFRKLPDYTDQVEARSEINAINTRNGDEHPHFFLKRLYLSSIFLLKAGHSL